MTSLRKSLIFRDMKFCDFYIGGKPIARRVKYCASLGSKVLGLMFVRSPRGGAFLPDVTEIHMAFVRFKLNIVWLDKNFVVVKQKVAVPWGPYYGGGTRSVHVLELPIHNHARIKVGDRLKMRIYENRR